MAEFNKSKPALLGASLSAILTAGTDWTGGGSNKIQLVGVHLCNNDTVERKVQLVYTRSGTDYFLFADKTIPANDSIFLTTHLILDNGDILKAKADSANKVYLVISGIADVV